MSRISILIAVDWYSCRFHLPFLKFGLVLSICRKLGFKNVHLLLTVRMELSNQIDSSWHIDYLSDWSLAGVDIPHCEGMSFAFNLKLLNYKFHALMF